MNTNNFDQSSTGVNIELVCFYDSMLSRELFAESFKTLDKNRDQWFYTDHGNYKVEDFEKTYRITDNKKKVIFRFYLL